MCLHLLWRNNREAKSITNSLRLSFLDMLRFL